MQPITKDDLILIYNLTARTYSGNKLLSNATVVEKANLNRIKKNLNAIGNFYSNKFKPLYGPFETSVASGNDIAIGGTKLKSIWAGFFKGAVEQTICSSN